MQLGAIIIERGRRIADREAHPVEIERIVANQVGFEPLKRQGSAFSSSAHLAQSGDTLVGFDFHHRSNKAAPMGPVAVAQRRLKRNRDSRSLDISDLHRSALFIRQTHLDREEILLKRCCKHGDKYTSILIRKFPDSFEGSHKPASEHLPDGRSPTATPRAVWIDKGASNEKEYEESLSSAEALIPLSFSIDTALASSHIGRTIEPN